MTIDKRAFAAGVALLSGNAGRETDAALTQAWYRILSPRLTTEEFQRAVDTIIATKGGFSWPSAADILHVIYPPDAAKKALADVTDRVRAFGGHLYFPHAEFQKLTEAQKAGVRAAGGLAKLWTADIEDMPRLEKRFAEGYESVAGSSRLEAGDPEPVRRIGKRSNPTSIADIAKSIPTTVFGDRS